MGSSSTSLRRIRSPPELSPYKRWRRSWRPSPSGQRSLTSKTTFPVLSSYPQQFLANHSMTQSEHAPAIWIIIPKKGGAHMLGSPLPLLSWPLPPLFANVYSQPPLRTSTWQGISRSDPARVQTCRTCNSKGGVSYLYLEPLSYPTCGHEWSVTGGWSDLGPSTDIPLKGVLPLLSPWGRRPGRYWVLYNGGVGIPQVLLSNAVLYLALDCKRSCYKVHHALRIAYPLVMSGLVCHALHVTSKRWLDDDSCDDTRLVMWLFILSPIPFDSTKCEMIRRPRAPSR